MVKLLGILLVSFFITFVAAIPFIDLLYKLKFQRQKESQKDIFGTFTSIVNRLHGWKVGTPNAGGILIITVSIILSAVFYKLVPGYEIVTKLYGVNWTSAILYLTLILFGLLGLYDDIRKFYGFKLSGAWGLRLRYKFLLQVIISLFIGYLLFYQMGISSVHIPIVNADLHLGHFYVLWSALIILSTTNAVNITDGLDGLAVGLSVFVLVAFWVLSAQAGLGDINLFIAVMIGSLLAFLYFNIYPARVWLGDTGALSLGAMLAVISLILDASLILPIVGFMFMLEAVSSLLQLFAKGFFKKRVFIAAPLHHHFEAKGWDETKVTMRFWLAGSVFAFAGLFVALL